MADYFLNNLIGGGSCKEQYGGSCHEQHGGAETDEPVTLNSLWPGWGFIILLSLIILAFVLIILVFRKTNSMEEDIKKMTGDVKVSKGMVDKLKDFFTAPPPPRS